MALPNAKILIHQVSSGFQGQATDIEIHAKEIIDIRRRLDEIIAQHTKQPYEKVRDRYRARLLHEQRRGAGLRHHRPGDPPALTHGASNRLQRTAPLLLLRQVPAPGQEAHRRPRRLHLRRVHRSLQRDHRRGADGSADLRHREPPQAAGDLRRPRRVRRRPGGVQAHAVGRGLQPLQARADDAVRRQRHRAAEVQHPAARPDGLRQDAARPDARPDPQRPVRDRRRHGADRGRLRRRGRREHPAQAHPGGRLRRQEGRDGDHLHRRGRQDRAQGRQPVDHARRLRRGRPAGAAEDPRGHDRVGPAAGRAQASPPGVPVDRHDERPVHLRRRVREPRQGHRAAHRLQRHRLRRLDQVQGPQGRAASSSSRRCPRTSSTTG